MKNIDEIIGKLKFDEKGLVTAVAQDHETGEILMLAFMNEESFRRTVETGQAVYWSRSRKKLWHKGEESGNVQIVKEIYVDCDADAIVLKIKQVGGAACHTGHRTCFYRRIENEGLVEEGTPLFDPDKVYKHKGE
ncbi:MAG: phosphoribosyl-AMP cyclohydrolase [Bacteroidetes bacterium]|jgi:phosphoribosyl-AMP cyclohydrolase|nr:phosphoribosyl-AMP cyclohydrolase [Bacteroidota bacterium]